ncbi:hypothetical protein IFM47457_10088 [Aspergillus lentulus]|nr:hypothetical protein IFM47457_10088 [Aspergillus lentulus]
MLVGDTLDFGAPSPWLDPFSSLEAPPNLVCWLRLDMQPNLHHNCHHSIKRKSTLRNHGITLLCLLSLYSFILLVTKFQSLFC